MEGDLEDKDSLLRLTSRTFRNFSFYNYKKYVLSPVCNYWTIFKYLMVSAIFLVFLLYQIEFIDIIRSEEEYSMRLENNGTKWIVITSIHYPTEDVKRLVAEEGWHLVVVGDKKTPLDWKCPGAHFLSVKMQKKLFPFARKLPLNSYTRKSIGYLYAIMNGATWIYDTDDDNKPYGQFFSKFLRTDNRDKVDLCF